LPSTRRPLTPWALPVSRLRAEGRKAPINDGLRCIRTSATVMRHAFGKACCTPSAFGRFSEARVIRVRS
jgi:hypothetical protein